MKRTQIPHVYWAALRQKVTKLLGGSIEYYPERSNTVRLSPSMGTRAAILEAPRRSGYEADMSHAAFLEWQVTARERLAAMVGWPHIDTLPTVIERRETVHIPTDGENASASALVGTTYYLRVRPEMDVPVTLLKRVDLKKPAKLYLYLAGSTSGVHVGWGEAKLPIDFQRVSDGADMARQAAERGYLAACIELAGFGEREERDLPKRSADRLIDAANHNLLIGRTLLGLRVSDVSAVIDWLTGLTSPHAVDPSQIFLFGHSSGGTTALFASALDTRISGTLASGSVGRYSETVATRGSPSGENIIPGFLREFETDDVIALTAPRPFVGLSGVRDHIFPFSAVDNAIQGALPAYRILDAASNLAAAKAPAGHRYYSSESWQAWQQYVDPCD